MSACLRKFAVLVLLGLPFSGNAVAADDAATTLDAAWEGVAERFGKHLADEHVVGGAIVFVDPTGKQRSAFFGVQDLDTGVPVSERTIFHWASITKTFTAIAAMQLAGRGMLDLQAPAVKYLPELRAVHDPFGPIEDVRVVDLMTHTAGFRAATWPWGGEPWQPYEPTQWSQLVAMMPYTEILFPPGSRFSYSNPGYTFLGRIVEVLSGESIETYIDKNVLRPLEMYDSYFDLTPPFLVRYRSNNYYLVDGKPVANGIDFDTGVTNGNGGLNASIADMTRYLRFLAGQGRDDGFPLERARLREMWQPMVGTTQPTGGGDRDPRMSESMGRGFFVVDFDPDGPGGTPADRFIGHTGTQMGFRAFLYFDPETGAGALIAANTRAKEHYRDLYQETRRDLFRTVFAVSAGKQPVAP